jgi:hypothetical protein
MSRRGIAGALFALVVAAGTLVGPLVAGAAGPHVTVKPATGLKKGQVVRVSGSGFKPHDQVYLVECLRTAKGQAGCAIATAKPATITAAGTLPVTTFKVVTGRVGNGTCGTTAANLAKCAVSVGNVQGKDSAVAPITFKRG